MRANSLQTPIHWYLSPECFMSIFFVGMLVLFITERSAFNTLTWCWGRVCGSDKAPLLHIQDDRLLLREVLQHGFERGLFAEAGILEPAITEVGGHDDVLINLNETSL